MFEKSAVLSVRAFRIRNFYAGQKVLILKTPAGHGSAGIFDKKLAKKRKTGHL